MIALEEGTDRMVTLDLLHCLADSCGDGEDVGWLILVSAAAHVSGLMPEAAAAGRSSVAFWLSCEGVRNLRQKHARR